MKRYVAAAVLRASVCAALLVCSVSSTAIAQSVPSPWASRDIGDPVLSGSATLASGVFSIDAAGSDIWGTYDQFHFVYQQIAGDVEIIAKVHSLVATDAWAKAGVMVRASLDADSSHGYAMVSGTNGVWFDRRTAPGGFSTNTAGPSIAAPVWLRAVRRGSDVSTYWSTTGTSWTAIGHDTIDLGTSAYVGIAVLSHNPGVRTTAEVSNVTIIGALQSSQLLPEGQQNTDIGAPALQGSATYASDSYTIKAGGVDIWDTADQFHFVYQPMSGSGEVIARLVSLGDTDEWAKAGVMIRESLSAQSRHAMVAITPGQGYAFQRRADPAAESLHTGGGTGAAPGWVRLVRTGDLFEAYRSADGTTWTRIGSDTIAMGETVYAGLAVTSHNTTAATTALIDNFRVATQTAGNQAPVVSITSPTTGAQFTAPATITIAATATDPEARMTALDFYAGSTLIGRDATAPYSLSWSVSAAGTYALSAVAHDADGGSSTSSAVNVIVAAANDEPTVSLTSPADQASFAAPATIGLAAATSSPRNQVERVEFFAGTMLLATDRNEPYEFEWTGVAAGTYSLTAVVHDKAGLSATSAARTVTVTAGSDAANKPPTVTLSTGGILSILPLETITLTATASDPEGQLARVEFFNGTTRLATDTTAPYSFAWSGADIGIYTFTAVAYDAAGASATSPAIAVTVSLFGDTTPPKAVVFTASSDHETNVTNYVLKVFAAGVNPATASPIATSDLGKPSPATNGDITVDRSTFFSGLAAGSYLATVTAVGPGGHTQSASVSFTR